MASIRPSDAHATDRHAGHAPGELELDRLLLQGAIVSIGTAIEAIENGDAPRCTNAVTLANAIVAQLYLNLGPDAPAQRQRSLGQIYNFVMRHLPSVTAESGAGRARQIRTLLEPLCPAAASAQPDGHAYA